MWISFFSILFILCGYSWCHVINHVHNDDESLKYLNKYGYNPCANSSKNVACSVGYQSMLREFQKRFGLNMTGILDEPTKNEMNRPRCGNPDKETLAAINSKWSRSTFTWSMRTYPRQISSSRVRAIIQEAFRHLVISYSTSI